MSKAVLCVVLLVQIVLMQLSAAQDNNNEMTFRTTDKGLPWPLPDLENYGLMAYHGVHCVQVLLSPHDHHDATSDDEREMDSMHQKHCAKHVRSMLDYVESVPNYSVPTHVCMDMPKTATQPGVEAADRTLKCIFGYGRGGTCIFLTYPRNTDESSIARRHVLQQTIDQYLQFTGLEAINFGRLLMAEMQGVPLTPAEATYLQKLAAPQSVRVGATGVYCQYGTSTIQTMSTAIQKQSQAKVVAPVACEEVHAK